MSQPSLPKSLVVVIRELFVSLSKIVKGINALESKYQSLKNEDFKGLTEQFKQRVANGETLEALLPEVFAVAREAAKRIIRTSSF